MSTLVIYSCLSGNSRKRCPCLLVLCVEFLSSKRDGVHPNLDFIPGMFLFLTKFLFFGVVPSRILLSCGLTQISSWSPSWIPLSASVSGYSLLWLVEDAALAMGKEVALVSVPPGFFPALLTFAFVQLFLIVLITPDPVCSSFNDFLLLLLPLLLPMADHFLQISVKLSARWFCLFRSLQEERQLIFCLL